MPSCCWDLPSLYQPGAQLHLTFTLFGLHLKPFRVSNVMADTVLESGCSLAVCYSKSSVNGRRNPQYHDAGGQLAVLMPKIKMIYVLNIFLNSNTTVLL